MINRRLRILERWSVQEDSERPGYTVITGVQQWDSWTLAGISALVVVQVSVMLLGVFGLWALLPVALCVLVLPFAQRFHLLITPHGAFCTEAILGFPIARTAFPIEPSIELYEDLWEGPDHPIGVSIMNPETYDEVIVGPARDLLGQQALQSVIKTAFRKAAKRPRLIQS